MDLKDSVKDGKGFMEWRPDKKFSSRKREKVPMVGEITYEIRGYR